MMKNISKLIAVSLIGILVSNTPEILAMENNSEKLKNLFNDGKVDKDLEKAFTRLGSSDASASEAMIFARTFKRVIKDKKNTDINWNNLSLLTQTHEKLNSFVVVDVDSHMISLTGSLKFEDGSTSYAHQDLNNSRSKQNELDTSKTRLNSLCAIVGKYKAKLDSIVQSKPAIVPAAIGLVGVGALWLTYKTLFS